MLVADRKGIAVHRQGEDMSKINNSAPTFGHMEKDAVFYFCRVRQNDQPIGEIIHLRNCGWRSSNQLKEVVGDFCEPTLGAVKSLVRSVFHQKREKDKTITHPPTTKNGVNP